FGDKMSPLSDTTNLAPAVAGTDLFTHIRHMSLTTGPSFLIALVLYLIIGLGVDVGSDMVQLRGLMATLDSSFNVTPLALIPLVVVFVCAMRKVPPLPTIDRKSTRLNSRHVKNSYALFCLKKHKPPACMHSELMYDPFDQ